MAIYIMPMLHGWPALKGNINTSEPTPSAIHLPFSMWESCGCDQATFLFILYSRKNWYLFSHVMKSWNLRHILYIIYNSYSILPILFQHIFQKRMFPRILSQALSPTQRHFPANVYPHPQASQVIETVGVRRELDGMGTVSFCATKIRRWIWQAKFGSRVKIKKRIDDNICSDINI